MNKYKAFYRNKTIDVEASTSYDAQCKAAAQFRAKKSYEVSVMLCELGDQPVVHSTASI